MSPSAPKVSYNGLVRLTMPLIIPPGFGSAFFELVGSPGTSPYGVTLGVDLSTAGGDFVGAANSLFAAYADSWMPATNDDLTLERVILTVGQDGGGQPSVTSDLGGVPGSKTTTASPTAMSLIVRKNTAQLGRRGRGRMFIPGVLDPDAVAEDGSLSSGDVITYNGIAADFYERVATPGAGPFLDLPPVLFHGSAPSDPTPISSLSVQPLVGWIRGRIR